jgi:hypothetical protein
VKESKSFIQEVLRFVNYVLSLILTKNRDVLPEAKGKVGG